MPRSHSARRESNTVYQIIMAGNSPAIINGNEVIKMQALFRIEIEDRDIYEWTFFDRKEEEFIKVLFWSSCDGDFFSEHEELEDSDRYMFLGCDIY